MDAGNNLEGKKGDGDKSLQQRAIGQLGTPRQMPRSQDWPLIIKCIDNDLQLVARWNDPEYITEIHVHEGRDIEGLVAALDDLGRTLGLHRDKVGMPLAERVVDFP